MSKEKDLVFEIRSLIFSFFSFETDLCLELTEWIHFLGRAKLQITDILIDLRELVFNIINLNGLSASSNQVACIAILGNLMETSLFFHIIITHNCRLVKVNLINSVWLTVICFTPKYQHRLIIFAFYHCRALGSFMKLKGKFSPFIIPIWVTLYQSCPLVVTRTPSKNINVFFELNATSFWTR